MNNRIEKIRQEIDKIDDDIISNLINRINLARELGKLKARNRLKIHDPEREEFVLNRLSKAAGDLLTKDDLKKIYQAIFILSQNIESKEKQLHQDKRKPKLKRHEEN